jgi:hypothetical protein
MRESKSYRDLAGLREGNIPLGDVDAYRMMLLKWNLKE